jgi:hypothetical protein
MGEKSKPSFRFFQKQGHQFFQLLLLPTAIHTLIRVRIYSVKDVVWNEEKTEYSSGDYLLRTTFFFFFSVDGATYARTMIPREEKG